MTDMKTVAVTTLLLSSDNVYENESFPKNTSKGV